MFCRSRLGRVPFCRSRLGRVPFRGSSVWRFESGCAGVERQTNQRRGHRFWRLVATAYPPLRLSGVIFRLLSKVFGEMPVFFVGEFVESCTSCGSVSDGFCDAVAALCRVAHSGWCVRAVYHDVLALGTMLCVPVCIQVVLTNVQSANRRSLGRCCNSFDGLVFDGFMRRW